jgi:uncharacterized protein (TIGR03435 family)
MNRVVTYVAIAVLLSCTVFAQSPEPRPSFDIADVHVSARTTNPSMRGGFIRGGRYELRTATMVDLIRTAYGVEANNVVGGPAWLDTDRFDVIANAPPASTPETLKLMLQSLLADRFKLVVHNDTKALSGYVLTFAKRSSQLKEADPASGKTGCQPASSEPTPGGIPFVSYSCRNVTMEAFAQTLRGMAPGYTGGNLIVDQTELKGVWDFDIKWNGRAQVANAGSDGISLFGAIEKLGLKLSLQNVPLSVIAVDSVNRKPTDNPPGITKSLPVVPLEFEVADIKPSAPGTTDATGGFQPGGRVDLHGMTLKDLIELAWDVDADDTIVGGPKWLDTNRFDVVAKASSTLSASGQQQIDIGGVQLMMRTLLIDRFRITTHSDVQPITVYALIAAKPKMKKADPSNRTSCKNIAAGASNLASLVSRNFTCQNISMAQFADKLSAIAGGYIDHPVVDLTGLDGAWDFTLNFSPKRALQVGGGRSGDAGTAGVAIASDPNGAISLFEAVDKQLGLKLEQQKHPMPVMVIDHVEERPTDN